MTTTEQKRLSYALPADDTPCTSYSRMTVHWSCAMHDEAVGTLQAHAVALHDLHMRVPGFKLTGPTRKAVKELEHCIIGDGIPEMIAIY